jgi:hypothetical protein
LLKENMPARAANARRQEKIMTMRRIADYACGVHSNVRDRAGLLTLAVIPILQTSRNPWPHIAVLIADVAAERGRR